LSVHVQALLVDGLTLVLYIGVYIWLVIRGWPILAALATVPIAVLPLVWQIIMVPDSNAPGSGMLAMLLWFISTVLLLAGLARHVVWFFERKFPAAHENASEQCSPHGDAGPTPHH